MSTTSTTTENTTKDLTVGGCGVAGQIVSVHCTSTYRSELRELLNAEEDATIRMEAYAYDGPHVLYCLLLSDTDSLERGVTIWEQE